MLDEIVKAVRSYEGLMRKGAISEILEQLKPVEDMGRTVLGFGEDCAVIKHRGGYLLLAAESIWSKLLEDPEWAGYCSVLTNVNDVYSMGGHPLAIVDTISFRNDDEGKLIARGMRIGAEKFRVPIVGGHVQPEADSSALTVCIVGTVENPMTSFGCRADDHIVVAVDLDGRMKSRFPNFDSTSHKSSDEVLRRLEGLVDVAHSGLVSAAKDISNPGILGTIGMLLETSGVGAEIDIDVIPRPKGVGLKEWLLAYPGCGFILTTSEAGDVQRILAERDISTAVVGQATESRRMTVSLRGESLLLFDLEKEIITGAIPAQTIGAKDD